MKHFLSAVCLLFVVSMSAQQEIGPLRVGLFFAYQQHDKRFFGSDGIQSGWGTSQFGIYLDKQVARWWRFTWQLGAGYAREVNTFATPYDHCFDKPGSPCTDVLTRIDHYAIDMLQTRLTTSCRLLPKLRLELALIPQTYFYKQAKGYGKTSDLKPGLYSIELNPGIGYTARRLHVSLGFRLFQWKTIDRVYLYGNNFLSKNPGYLDRTFDPYNPFKILLSAAYIIGGNN